MRETGVDPVDRVVEGSLAEAACRGRGAAARRGRGLHRRHRGPPLGTTGWPPSTAPATVASRLIDPLSTKGLEWDATVVVDPEAITEESPGGVRVLYVVLTRAAHRMHVLRPA